MMYSYIEVRRPKCEVKGWCGHDNEADARQEVKIYLFLSLERAFPRYPPPTTLLVGV